MIIKMRFQHMQSDIRYSYNVDINIYDTDTSDGVTQLNPSTIMNTIYGTNTSQGSMSAMYTNADVWNQLPGNQDLLDSQYDMVGGKMAAAVQRSGVSC